MTASITTQSPSFSARTALCPANAQTDQEQRERQLYQLIQTIISSKPFESEADVRFGHYALVLAVTRIEQYPALSDEVEHEIEEFILEASQIDLDDNFIIDRPFDEMTAGYPQ